MTTRWRARSWLRMTPPTSRSFVDSLRAPTSRKTSGRHRLDGSSTSVLCHSSALSPFPPLSTSSARRSRSSARLRQTVPSNVDGGSLVDVWRTCGRRLHRFVDTPRRRQRASDCCLPGQNGRWFRTTRSSCSRSMMITQWASCYPAHTKHGRGRNLRHSRRASATRTPLCSIPSRGRIPSRPSSGRRLLPHPARSTTVEANSVSITAWASRSCTTSWMRVVSPISPPSTAASMRLSPLRTGGRSRWRRTPSRS